MIVRSPLVFPGSVAVLLLVSVSCGSDPVQNVDELELSSLESSVEDSDGPNDQTKSSSVDDDGSKDSTTVETFRIQASVEGQGSITLDPDEDKFAAGDQVTVSAVAEYGWVFSHWSEDFEDESKKEVTLEIEEDLSVTAHFVETFGLNTEVVGEGTIEIEPEKEFYLAGDEVTLTAVPAIGWKFAGFGGDVDESESSVKITVEEETSVTAQFVELLTLTTTVQGNGTMSIDPAQEYYEPGTVVTVEGIADDGWKFDRWETAQGEAAANPYEITLSEHTKISGVFIESVSTVYTTSVSDNLNPKDREILVDRLKQQGYEEIGVTENVSKSELIDLIAREDITVLYHTGHGTEGKIMTSNNGSVGVGDIDSVGVANLFIATCLTLKPTTWMEKMGPTAEGIFGYTKVSLDFVDNRVVNSMADELEEDKTFLQAWYTANTAQSQLRDRWLTYWREDDEVVEYSARSGNEPSRADGDDRQELRALSSNVFVANALIDDSRTFADQFDGLNSKGYRVKSNGKLHSEFFRAPGREFMTKSSMSTDNAQKIAQSWSVAKLPKDVRLQEVREINVVSAAQPLQKAAVGYAVRYQKQLDDLPVRTNGAAIFAELLVNDGTVVAQSSYWPTFETIAIVQQDIRNRLISVGQALAHASASINSQAKSPIRILSVSPCYGLRSQEIVPAYAFQDDTGLELIVDAQTGALLD